MPRDPLPQWVFDLLLVLFVVALMMTAIVLSATPR